jgi:hypothetical protein
MISPCLKSPASSWETDLRVKVKSQLPAIFCALAVVSSAVLIRPYAETGISDDWSYIKTTQILAQTGHIVYNGWASAMLGWQLYLGALFVKLFGFSFTTARLSTFLVAIVTAWLLQRTLARAGVSQWNATLATLTFVFSPLYLPLAFTFMSDVAGVFSILLCLYMCLRALQADTQAATIAWIGSAALFNAIGGTARQIAWLGVLVMIPSTLWLLRRRPRVLLAGGLCCLVGIAIVFASMHWFNQQPYALPERLIPESLGLKSFENIAASGLRFALELVCLMLPVLLMFVVPLLKPTRRMATLFVAGMLAFALMGGLILLIFSHHGLDHWVAPFLGPNITVPGLLEANSIIGARPLILPLGIRVLLTVATVVALVSLFTVVFGNGSRPSSLPGRAAAVSWRDLGVILVPFSAAYILMLMPRVAAGGAFDRYLLPLMVILLLVLARFYQEKVRPELPLLSAVLIGIAACFTIVATHDMFAMYRGYLAAFQEVRSSGVPATAISGSWENDGWTELETVGYINERRIRNPRGAYVYQPAVVFPAGCAANLLDRIPAVKPIYALSFDPAQCDGQAGFPPVVYRTWLPPHANTIYIVKFPAIPGR